MILLLTVLCIFGSFVLHWRRASLSGYFGSPTNVPGIFTYALGNLIVLGVGLIAYWGSGLLILILWGWPWAVLALLLGFAFRRPLMGWICGPPGMNVNQSSRIRTQEAVRAGQEELHYKVTFKKHIRWSGRIPIPDSSCDFVTPSGATAQPWVSLKFPKPFGEYGQEVRFYSTLMAVEFERACRDSADVLAYERVAPDDWQKAAAVE